MRNELEYPVTKQEVIDYLSKLQDELIKEGVVGDIRPVLLDVAIDAVKRT